MGKFDAKLPVEGTVTHPVALAHVDGASTHAPSDAIIVPDAQLLFGGDFKRSGVDLVLSKDDHELVLHDYFKGEKRAALASPDGAHLTGDLVNALTGHVEYAQAGGAAAAAAVVVGHVTKLTGSATAIRNGVSIILNQGDNIDKGDVLQSGADSTLGVTFIDGTVFGLSSNARMVVNEMIYDPNGSNNASLLSLVAGTISFVAGETAKHGDMKVDTPVATMGIRGTAVLVEIDFAVPGQGGAPSANFQVLVEPDGTTGSYILFDKNTLAPLATVNTAGTLTKISQGVVSFQTGTPLTPDEQKLINDLFTTKFGDNNTPKTTDHAFTDTPVPQSLTPIKLADGGTATPVVVVVVASSGGSTSSGSGTGTTGPGHVPGPPTVVTFNDAFSEHANITGSTTLDIQTGQIRFADPNPGDLPTVKVEFSSFTYQDAQQHDITQTLSPTEQAAIKAVEAISLQQDPGNKNTGSATWTYSFPDGAFDFLGAGEKLTLTYTALVDNNFLQSPETGTKQFTVTITGTNDVPVITSSIPQTIAFVGGTSVPGGDLTAQVPTSGTMTFADPDLTDTHTVSVKLLLDGLNLPPAPLQIFEQALTASIATDSTGTGTGTVNWKLADLPVYLADFIPKGETITLTYAVTVTDSQGATSTQDITVAVTGTDTPAVVWIATTKTDSAPGGSWSDASNWETGTVPTANDDAIIITNQLIGLTPSYPVTIDAETAAAAKSVTMNDFGSSPPELINLGTLTVGGAFNMSADSVLHNSGGIAIGGGGNFSDHSTITNTGTGLIELSGGTLNVGVDIGNAGQVAVDYGATLALSGAAIDGGAVINQGTLDLNGNAVMKNGTLYNINQVNVSGTGNAFVNETINNGSSSIPALLYNLHPVVNTGFDDNTGSGGDKFTVSGTLTLFPALLSDAINVTGTLALNGTTISGGSVAINGLIDVTGDSTITGAAITGGLMTIEAGQTLTLDGTFFEGSGFTILNIQSDDAESSTAGVYVSGTTITNDGTIKIDADNGIWLNNVAIGGGTIANSGSIEIVGSSSINNDALNNSQLTVDSSQTLTLDDTAVAGGVVSNYGTVTVDVDHALTLQGGVSVHGGTLDNSGTVDVEGSSGATLDGVTVTGSGHIQIDSDTDTSTTLVLEDGTTITDGTLTVGPAGVLYVQTASGATLHDVGVTNRETIEVFGGSTLTLDHGTSVTNTGGVITLDDTGTLNLNDVTVSGGGVTIGASALVKTSGDVTLTNTSVTNDGTIEITGGTLKITGSVASSGPDASGSIKIDSGAVLDLDASDTQNVVFAGSNGELRIDASSFGGNICGLAATDEIDLSTVGYGPGTTGTYSGGVLTITDGTHSVSMTLTGDYSDAHFAGASDGHGGTLITLNAADDAPAFAETLETAAVTERADITGSSASDPSPAASGALHFTDIDLTDRPTATITQSVTWTNGVTDLSSSLTPAEIGALEQAFSLTPADNANNGAIGWSYQISDSALDFLGAGETATVTSTVLLDDHQNGQDTAKVAVTITGANDLPTITATNGALAEQSGVTGSVATDTASGTISFADPDLHDRPTVTASLASSNAFDYKDAHGNDLTATLTMAQLAAIAALETGLVLSPDSANAHSGTVGWTYSVQDSALDFMAAGDTLTLNYTATVNDQHGGITTAPIVVTITGSDDAPAISGTAIAAVTDGGVVDASGTLTATDPDRGDAVTWSIVGGTNVASENYNYALDEFKVVKGSTTVFDDSFPGTAPPNGPNFLVGTTPVTGAYSVSGGSFAAGPHGTLLEGTSAAPAGISLGTGPNYGDVVYGQFVTLLTGTSFNGAAPSQGLRSGQSFTASAVFDLNTPADSTTHYGIRLSDRVNAATDAANDQPGTETVDLFVAHDANGGADVVLDELNFEAGTSTVLQVIHIAAASPGITDNEIRLSLSNSSASNGHITASFQVMGTNSDGIEVADGGPVAFTATGQIFDNENWTRAQAYGLSVATSDTAPADVTANAVSVLQGTYGTLDLNQNGTWQYFLNPGLASVKALAAGQTAHDVFTVAATDGSGVQTTKPVDITVTGINDAPVVDAHNSTLSYTENQAPAAIDAALTLSDVDSATLGSATVKISSNFVAGEDVLGFTDQNGIHGSYDAATGALSLTGTSSVANYQAALASVTYFDSSDNPSAAPRTISFAFDDGASENSTSNTVTAIVNVSPVDDAPVISFSPAGASIAENHATTINGLGVSDVDAGGAEIEVTLAAGNGSLALTDLDGLNAITGNGTRLIDLFGSQAAIDAALAQGVVYTPSSNYVGSDTLTVTANDEGHTGSGGPLTATDPIALTVNAVPVLTGMTLTVSQDGTDVLAPGDFSVSNPVSTDFYSVQNVTGGQFEVFNGENWVSAPTGGFTDAQIAAGQVEFVQDGTTTAPSFSIWVSDGTDASPAIAPSIHFAETPVITVPEGTQTFGVGEAAKIPGIGLSEAGNVSGETFTVTLTDSHGVLSANTVGDGDTVTVVSGTILTITGSLSDVNSDLATLTDTNGIAGSDPITLTAVDSFNNNAAPRTVGVSIQPAEVPATTLTFDNLPSTNDNPVPNGYGGLDWSNFYYLDSNTDAPVSGYAHGTVSAPDVAYNAYANTASISGATFNFIGADLTAAWNNVLSITVDGYDHSVLVDQETVVVNTGAPTWFEFDFNGVTNLVFSSYGGVNAGYDGSGTHFAMDNFTFSALTDPDVTIAEGGSFHISSPSADAVLFEGSAGELVLDNPSTFTGKIAGISGSGDVLDLGGFDADHDTVVATTGNGSYDSTTGTTSLIVTDQTTSHSVTLKLSGDYSTSTWTVTGDGQGGADVVDPPAASSVAIASEASSGSPAIASGGSLEIGHAVAPAETVTFQGSTGSLTLDTPSSFHGTIAGFSGDGTLSGSDQIDLKGIDDHSAAFSESFNPASDTLAVSDGTHSALLHFSGVYQAANFNFTTDHDGGTIVYDPPVPDGVSAGARTPPVTATGHGFVFNFADHGHQASDTHLFDGQTFVNAENSLNTLHDDVHANLVPAPDAVDLSSVAAIKAQLHAHDFHFA